MNTKAAYVLVAVLVAVIAVASTGVYLVYYIGNNAANNGGTTQPVSVANATSLQFTVNATINRITANHAFWGKHIGTSNLTLRVEVYGGELGSWSFIIDTAQQKSWNSTDNGAWIAGDYTVDWQFWGTNWNNLYANLQNWSGTGDYSCTSPTGYSIVIYNIKVNPQLPDALFQPS
jgi:hypothetical protein